MNVTKKIDGVEFSVSPFMSVEAIRLKVYLFRTFGPALGQMIGTLKNMLSDDRGINDNVQIDGAAFAGAIQSLTEQLDEESFLGLLKRMFANVVAKGKNKAGKDFAAQFDANRFDSAMNTVFQGRIFSIYPVMGLVLEANYPDFFEKTVRSIGKSIKRISTTEPESESGTEESGNSETSES